MAALCSRHFAGSCRWHLSCGKYYYTTGRKKCSHTRGKKSISWPEGLSGLELQKLAQISVKFVLPATRFYLVRACSVMFLFWHQVNNLPPVLGEEAIYSELLGKSADKGWRHTTHGFEVNFFCCWQMGHVVFSGLTCLGILCSLDHILLLCN
jgi:hypothetical protein